ncbi:MAG: HlyD family efflux transporter periplasmic adaptor subunit [Sulfurovum sp.]|uniref:HlyD family efflux transporter periplasmic adaptor subunit n=1 Tax=Sulfurovum sp. TaxID=1969726 RepID=UPI002867EEF2|nr:HlyD family efflux transporter periplasmic adaptor subunit [Sulfurovum sp.]MCO4844912.1 HlyD family efflux transporter periplasmic adaptor subunit [Sulfurovum sp.]
MKFFLLLFTPLFIFAKVHYAKVEPYESVILKSAVSALVMDVDLEAEGSVVDQKRVIYLDDRLDKINLKTSNENLLILHETLKRQESYFQRIDKLKTASTTQKDNAFYSFASAKTQYLDMQYKIAQLEDSIEKKSIVLHHMYLYEIMVRKGDYVAPGSPLARVVDESRAKLVLFVEPAELEKIEQKSVYLNGEKTEYKVDKVWRVADEKFISSYRAEIYITAPKGSFSKLMKIEIK